MKKILSTLFILSILFNAYSQVNKIGVPFITNYTPQEYNASEQNWAITTDNRGLIYFGNNSNGIIEYDGVNWRKIPIHNGSIVRSLTTDSIGKIYVGSVGDIGSLNFARNGKYIYESYHHLIDSTKTDFGDIWKTYANSSGIFFCSENYLFNYQNSNLIQHTLPYGTVFLFNLDDQIYIPSFNTGLLKLSDNKINPVKGGDFYKSKGVYTMSFFNDKFLVGTYPQGLFFYNPSIGKSHSAFNNNYLSNFVKNEQLYSSCNIDSNQLALGSIYNGFMTINKQGEIINHLNKSHGLQDEIIININKDLNNNLWLALNNGISKVELNNPINHFDEKNGIKGSIFDICKFNGSLFVATTLGVFRQSHNVHETPKFTQLESINGQTYSLILFNYKGENMLLVGNQRGLFKIDEKFNIEYIDKQILDETSQAKTNYIQKLYQSKKQPNKVYVALFDGVFSIEFDGVKWKKQVDYPVKGYDIRHIYEDKFHNVWFATFLNGVIQCENDDTSKMHFYNTDTGLPNNNEIIIGSIDSSVTIGTKNGFWKYSYPDNNFIIDKSIADFNSSTYFFNQDKKGDIWISALNDENKWVICYEKQANGSYIKNAIPFKRLPNQLYDVIFHDENEITWLGSASGLYSYDNKVQVDYSTPFNTLVRKVITKGDSILFYGTNFEINSNGDTIPSLKQPNEYIPELDYFYNDLTFQYASPYFIEEKLTEYAYQLVGYNKSWSKWNMETKAVFTNLSEGEYIFKAKAKNIYGYESSIAEYKFIIAPPWYRTIIAYVIYIVLGIIFLIIVVKLYTRKLEHEKIILEGIVQERTAEIRHQNDILKEQKEEIFKQKEEITASITYAQRIQRAIVPNEEKAASVLKDFFLLWNPRDIVSGDFWWLGEKDEFVVVTAADCTGHGVPGAFMSMLGVSFLNEIVNQQSITESGEILDLLRNKVKVTLGQNDENSTNKDGMDIALLVIDFNKMQAQYSGAYNPLYLYRNGELLETKATRNPIGVYIKEKPFEQNLIELQKGDVMYLFSDGFPDQFGGEKEKKYSTKRFKELLLSIHTKPMNEQKQILNQEFTNWRGPVEQIDDVIILGIRI